MIPHASAHSGETATRGERRADGREARKGTSVCILNGERGREEEAEQERKRRRKRKTKEKEKELKEVEEWDDERRAIARRNKWRG